MNPARCKRLIGLFGGLPLRSARFGRGHVSCDVVVHRHERLRFSTIALDPRKLINPLLSMKTLFSTSKAGCKPYSHHCAFCSCVLIGESIQKHGLTKHSPSFLQCWETHPVPAASHAEPRPSGADLPIYPRGPVLFKELTLKYSLASKSLGIYRLGLHRRWCTIVHER